MPWQWGNAEFKTLTVQELGIGTFKDIYKVTYETPLLDALKLLSEKHISGVPIVSATGKVIRQTHRCGVKSVVDNSLSHLRQGAGYLLEKRCQSTSQSFSLA